MFLPPILEGNVDYFCFIVFFYFGKMSTISEGRSSEWPDLFCGSFWRASYVFGLLFRSRSATNSQYETFAEVMQSGFNVPSGEETWMGLVRPDVELELGS